MCLSSRNGDRMSPGTHPHILLCSRWALRILMWTIEGQCKHCGNVCGPTRKILLLTKRCFFSSRHRLEPWLVFWLPERPISLAGGIQIILWSKMTERGGCDIDHAIIEMSAHKWHHWHHNLRLPILYSLETKTRSKLNLYVYARLTLNFVLCTFTEQGGIKKKCNLILRMHTLHVKSSFFLWL